MGQPGPVRCSTRGRVGTCTRGRPSTIHTEPDAVRKQPGGMQRWAAGFYGCFICEVIQQKTCNP